MDTNIARGRPSAGAVFEDGLGKRYEQKGANGDPLSVLVLSQAFTSTPGLEASLREQLTRLGGFHHPSFAKIHRVARVVNSEKGVAIASEDIRGRRLSTLLAAAESRGVPFDLKAAWTVLSQLVSAVALLHERVPGFYHGAISPERVLVTPEGRVVVTEHILGTTIAQMHWMRQQYWRTLRVALPEGNGAAAFDQRVDVAQIGAVAMALLLGHPLGADYPSRVGGRLEGTSNLSAAAALELLPDGIQAWMSRALQLDADNAFASAIEARSALELALDDTDFVGAPEALAAFMNSYEDGIAPPSEPVLVDAAPEPAPIHSTAVPAASVAPAYVAPPPLPVSASDPWPARVAEPQRVDATATADVEPEPLEDLRPVEVAHITTDLKPLNDYKPEVQHVSSETEASHAEPVVPVAEARPEPLKPFSNVTTFSHHKPLEEPARPEPVRLEPSRSDLPQPVIAAATVRKVEPAEDVPESKPFQKVARMAVVPKAITPEPPAPSIADRPSLFGESTSDAEEAAAEWPAHRDWKSQLLKWRVAAAIAAVVIAGSATTFAARQYFKNAAVTTQTGTLTLVTDPAGAAISVDGVQRGTTPLKLDLAAGTHTIELANDNGRRTVPITLAAGAQLSQVIEMPRVATATTDGQLQIRTEPSGARVLVDGQARGTSPVTVSGLTAGNHTVTLISDLGTITEQVTVPAGAMASLVVPLGNPSGAPLSGWITINAPAELSLYEKGEMLGTSRTGRIMAAAGRHEIELVNEALGFRANRVITIQAGQTITVTPEWPAGTVALNAVPWAEVSVDGRNLGETPIGSVSLPVGRHEFVFRHPELGEQRQTATVTAQAPLRLSIDMNKRQP